MRCKHGHHEPRHRPYGQKRGYGWCRGCDGELVRNDVSKKRARRDGKREIEAQLGAW